MTDPKDEIDAITNLEQELRCNPPCGPDRCTRWKGQILCRLDTRWESVMIRSDAIAIVTSYGRYERVMRSQKQELPSGHRTAVDEIAWKLDTKTPADEGIPQVVCNACMKAWVAASLRSGGRRT